MRGAAGMNGDPTATPARAPGAYMMFCRSERPKIEANNPGMAFDAIAKALGLSWGKLSVAERAAFAPAAPAADADATRRF
jgi:hypothetical protein